MAQNELQCLSSCLIATVLLLVGDAKWRRGVSNQSGDLCGSNQQLTADNVLKLRFGHSIAYDNVARETVYHTSHT